VTHARVFIELSSENVDLNCGFRFWELGSASCCLITVLDRNVLPKATVLPVISSARRLASRRLMFGSYVC
jgi:hypothetical protein